MGRIIAIVNQKGGVGKTTTAVNLAASLAVAERLTLLVDCDPQGNATSGLGAGGRDKTLYDVVVEQVPLAEAVTGTELSYLKLVPSNVDLFGADLELAGQDEREHVLARALSEVAGDYEYVLLDCPPSLGLMTVNALAAAQSVLIPLQAEYYALEGLTQLITTIRMVQNSLNPGLHISGILLTMFDGRNNLARQVEDDVREHFGNKVFETVIARNVRLSEAPGFGKPALLYDIRSSGAQHYLALAKEIIQADAAGNGNAS